MNKFALLGSFGLQLDMNGDTPMSENSVVRARINEETKEAATTVLAAMGLSVSDAIRMMMTRIAAEKALPFDPLVPNAQTIAAMEAARRGDTIKTETTEALFSELNAPD